MWPLGSRLALGHERGMLWMLPIPDGFGGEGRENHRPRIRSVFESDTVRQLVQTREKHTVPVAKILGDILLVGEPSGPVA